MYDLSFLAVLVFLSTLMTMMMKILMTMMATTNDNPDHDINGHHDEHLIMMTLVTKITI